MNESPAAVATIFDAAVAAYRAGNAAKAADGFASVLAASPDHPDALRLYGLALTRSGRAREGLPFLARSRRLAWREAIAHHHYGIGLLEAGQPVRAAAVLRRAAMLAPRDAAIWINFSAALLAVNEPNAARAAARRARSAASGLAEAHYALGLAELACGDAAAAHSAFWRALQIRPDFVAALLNFGLVRYRNGDIAGAEAAMRRALAVEPENAEAQANLAAFMLLGGETDEAIAKLRGALRRAPGSVPIRLNLANALLLEREPQEALSLLEGPVPHGREGLHWQAHRVRALMELGRNEEARTELDAIAPPYADAEILILWRRIALAPANEALILAERLAVVLDDESMLPEHPDHWPFRARPLPSSTRREGYGLRALDRWAPPATTLSTVLSSGGQRIHRRLSHGVRPQPNSRCTRRANSDAAPVFIVGHASFRHYTH